MITLPEMLQNVVVRFGLSVEFKPEHPPNSTAEVVVRDSNGDVVDRHSLVSLDENIGSVISFIEDCVRKYATEKAA